MDIAGVSMALSQAKINNDVGVAVLSKAMDTNESLGDGLVRMLEKADMERSVNPKVGSNIDLYASSKSGGAKMLRLLYLRNFGF